MSVASDILVLVADDDDTSRQMISDVLKSQGYKVMQAINGGAAIKVLEEWHVDLALIDNHMSPVDGFAVAKHTMMQELGTGIILMTDSPTTDILLESGKYGVKQIMQKPIDPAKLVQIVRRVLQALGKNPDEILAQKRRAQSFTPEDLMKRVIALAEQNAKAQMGGPFAAIVTDAEGRILGEGANSVNTRCDPTAHAEVLAIRAATDKVKKPRLDGCTIYCSSEPTMLGQALIIGTGIKKVYYGLSHEDVGINRATEEGILGEIAKPLNQRTVEHENLMHDQAAEMFREWQQQNKIMD